MDEQIRDGVQTGCVSGYTPSEILIIAAPSRNVEECFRFIERPTIKDLEEAEKGLVVIVSLIPNSIMDGFLYEDYNRWLSGFLYGLNIPVSTRHTVFFYEGTYEDAKKRFESYKESGIVSGVARVGKCNILRKDSI